MVRLLITACVALFGLGISLAAQTQVQPAPAPAPAPATFSPQQVQQKLGVFVYPAHHQTEAKQNADEKQCYTWAREQTGIDPMAPPPQPAQTAATEQPPSNAGKGSVAKGAAGGAVAGTAIGAVTGNTGTGAATGATVGALGGVAHKKKAQKQAEAQQQQAQAQAQQQAQAQEQQRLGTFKKAYSACLQGRGYSVQ